MPTGALHYRTTTIEWEVKECRCMIGVDHFADGTTPEDDDDGFSFSGAEEIYDSSGRDEDYDFR